MVAKTGQTRSSVAPHAMPGGTRMAPISTSTVAPSTQSAPAPRAAALSMVSVSKVYGSGPGAGRAVDDVTVAFPGGTYTAVMGPAGSGKSSLLNCAAGLDRPSAGQVLLGDVDLAALDERRLTLMRRERIGFVFQSLNLVPSLTAEQNALLPLRL